MASNNQAKVTRHEKTQQGEEESLSTLLDENQRGELTFLIASAAAAMRKTITSSFDANVRVVFDVYGHGD